MTPAPSAAPPFRRRQAKPGAGRLAALTGRRAAPEHRPAAAKDDRHGGRGARAAAISARGPLLFRGWLVVTGAFLVLMVGFGAAYSYAAFADEIAAAFGTSRASVSVVFALCGGTCFFASAVSGPLADRVGPRSLAAAGMVAVGLGLALAGAARSLLDVLLCYGLLTGLGVGLAYVPAVAAVQRWFVARRGLASGIAASGIGFGTALVPPAAEALSRFGDWRVALTVLGPAAALVGLAGALLLDASPEGRGLRPDGGPGTATAPPEALTVTGVVRTRAFALAYAGALLVSIPVSLPFAHLAASALDLGLPRTEALGLVGLIGLGSIAGRFALGALADAAGRRATFLFCCAGVAAATLLWAVADAAPLLRAFAFSFGALYGGFVALLPAFVTDCFGRRSAGGVIGLLYTSRGVALLAGPPAVALGAEFAGAHALPVAAASALGLLGTVLLALARPPATAP
jgi:MFS transporter, OFA family, oxalate/formate antiporter